MAFLSITTMISLQSCVDKCRDVTCQNGGTCYDGECDCPTGYSGTNCEIEPCTYVQWTGTLNCQSGYYPVSNTTCCPTGYPYFFGTSCYATCQGADGAANGATVYRYNDGSGGGGGGGGGSCTFVQWTGAINCQSGYYPVSNTACCPTGNPYFFGTSCYTTCEAATQSANGATVYRYNDGTGGGGGGGGGTAGYNCVSGSCQSVSSGAQYSSLSACQNQCGSGGPTEIVNTCVSSGSGGNYSQYVSFTVPAGVTSMEVRTSEMTSPCTYNAADLYVRRGSQPTVSTADCISDNVNRQQDFCQFTNPQSGTWWVMLYNSNGGHFESTLVVTITQ